MGKKVKQVEKIAAGDSLLKAVGIMEYIEEVAAQKHDTETLFNLAALYIDIFGRLSESDGEITGDLGKPGHPKQIGFGIPSIPGKNDE